MKLVLYKTYPCRLLEVTAVNNSIRKQIVGSSMRVIGEVQFMKTGDNCQRMINVAAFFNAP